MLLAAATEAAQAAGKIIREAKTLHVQHKGTVDLVTQIDLAAEHAICEILTQRTPGIPILAEEGGGAATESTRWIVDPLDGTTNFVHNFPSYAVSIALQQDGELVVGCILDVVLDLTYTAKRGCGAFCEGEPIRVSTTNALQQSLLLTGFPYDRHERAAHYLSFVQAFMEQAQGIRRAGAAALDFTHIAAGKADGFWEFNLSPWDVAAGILLVEEAGGKVTDMNGSPLSLDKPRLLASNGIIHDQMRQILNTLIS